MAVLRQQAPAAVSHRRNRAPHRPNWLAGVLAVIWLAFVVLPIWIMAKDSLQPQQSYQDGGPLSLPAHLTGSNFGDVFRLGFPRYLLNTAIVTVASVLLTAVLAFPAAYAIVRSRYRTVSAVFRIFLAGLAIPAQATIIPVYLLITRMHLYDSLTAIVLPTVAFGLPLSVLVLSSALRDVPRELYEAMAIDGGGATRLMWSLALPMSRSSLTTVSIYSALNAWNGFLFPLILTQSDEQRVQTLGLYNFQGQFGANVPGLMAAVLLSALPIFIAYVFARRWLIAGLAGVGGK